MLAGVSSVLTGQNFSQFAYWAKESCNLSAEDGTNTWAFIMLEEVFEALESEPESKQLDGELLQIAAVAMQWRAAIRRRVANREAAAEVERLKAEVRDA